MENLPYDDRRIVEGYGSVEILDNSGEIIPISEIKKYMHIYENRGAPLLYGHKNQPVGKVIDWEITEVDNKPAIKIKGKLFKDYPEDDLIWEKVKNKIITGFSFGGGIAKKELKEDGTYLYDTPLFEWSLVEKPCNPQSIITAVSVAKSDETITNSVIPFIDINGGETMVEKVKKEEIPQEEVQAPSLEDRISYLEKIVAELIDKFNTNDDVTEKEEPKEEEAEMPKEEDKEVKEEEPKEDLKEDLEEVKKSLTELKDLVMKQDVKKSDIASVLPEVKNEIKDAFREKFF